MDEPARVPTPRENRRLPGVRRSRPRRDRGQRGRARPTDLRRRRRRVRRTARPAERRVSGVLRRRARAADGVYGRRPLAFFREPWNVFDFVIIAAAFVPGLRTNSTLLRLARMLRVVRVVRLLPELRVLTLAMTRSLPPLFSMAVLTTVILFVYGMIGWLLFGDEDPERWGRQTKR